MIRKPTPSRSRSALLARGIAIGASIEIFPSSAERQTTTMAKHSTTTTPEPELDPKRAKSVLDEIDKILAKHLADYDPADRAEAIGQLQGAVEPAEPAEPKDGAPAPPLTQRERELCEKRGIAPAAYARVRDAIRERSKGSRRL